MADSRLDQGVTSNRGWNPYVQTCSLAHPQPGIGSFNPLVSCYERKIPITSQGLIHFVDDQRLTMVFVDVRSNDV